MPDDSKGVCTLAGAMRSWAEVELRKAVDEALDPYASTAQRELDRRGRACWCFLGQAPRRDCPRHEGSLG